MERIKTEGISLEELLSGSRKNQQKEKTLIRLIEYALEKNLHRF